MPKSKSVASTHRKTKSGTVTATRDSGSGRRVDRRRSKGTRREILFPTEPTSIPHEEIDRAIDAVMSRRK
jgi:hypothetical protein